MRNNQRLFIMHPEDYTRDNEADQLQNENNDLQNQNNDLLAENRQLELRLSELSFKLLVEQIKTVFKLTHRGQNTFCTLTTKDDVYCISASLSTPTGCNNSKMKVIKIKHSDLDIKNPATPAIIFKEIIQHITQKEFGPKKLYDAKDRAAGNELMLKLLENGTFKLSAVGLALNSSQDLDKNWLNEAIWSAKRETQEFSKHIKSFIPIEILMNVTHMTQKLSVKHKNIIASMGISLLDPSTETKIQWYSRADDSALLNCRSDIATIFGVEHENFCLYHKDHIQGYITTIQFKYCDQESYKVYCLIGVGDIFHMGNHPKAWYLKGIADQVEGLQLWKKHILTLQDDNQSSDINTAKYISDEWQFFYSSALNIKIIVVMPTVDVFERYIHLKTAVMTGVWLEQVSKIINSKLQDQGLEHPETLTEIHINNAKQLYKAWVGEILQGSYAAGTALLEEICDCFTEIVNQLKELECLPDAQLDENNIEVEVSELQNIKKANEKLVKDFGKVLKNYRDKCTHAHSYSYSYKLSEDTYKKKFLDLNTPIEDLEEFNDLSKNDLSGDIKKLKTHKEYVNSDSFNEKKMYSNAYKYNDLVVCFYSDTGDHKAIKAILNDPDSGVEIIDIVPNPQPAGMYNEMIGYMDE